jgi:hypothetical protein
MKTSLLIILIFLFSCTKEQQDFRDQYTGTYRGPVTFDLPGWQHSRENNAFIVKGTASNELAIQNLGIPSYSIAILSNNTYTYYPFNNGSLGQSVIAQYRGRGTFNGDSLCEEGTIMISSYGVIESGTWCTKMKKDKTQ